MGQATSEGEVSEVAPESLREVELETKALNPNKNGSNRQNYFSFCAVSVDSILTVICVLHTSCCHLALVVNLLQQYLILGLAVGDDEDFSSIMARLCKLRAIFQRLRNCNWWIDAEYYGRSFIQICQTFQPPIGPNGIVETDATGIIVICSELCQACERDLTNMKPSTRWLSQQLW